MSLGSSGSIGRAAGLTQKPVPVDQPSMTFARPMAPVAPVAPVAPMAPYAPPPVVPGQDMSGLPPPPPMGQPMAPPTPPSKDCVYGGSVFGG